MMTKEGVENQIMQIEMKLLKLCTIILWSYVVAIITTATMLVDSCHPPASIICARLEVMIKAGHACLTVHARGVD